VLGVLQHDVQPLRDGKARGKHASEHSQGAAGEADERSVETERERGEDKEVPGGVRGHCARRR
jgi:hypothetical protein